MIVCLCRGVADRVIGRAIADGAATLCEIEAACDAGSDCGACHDSLLALLANSRACDGRLLASAAAHAGA